MIELPEAITLARQIGDALAGKRVASVIANASPHAMTRYCGDPVRYADLLMGRGIVDADAFGGYIVIRFQEMRLLMSDGAYPRYLSVEVPRPQKHQLLIEFEGGEAMCCVVQMYGDVCAYGQEGFDDEDFRAACEKPSPLTEAFTPAYFESLRAKADGKLAVKAFLAAEQRIPGVGNGVLQDILYNATVHPARKLASLSDADCEKMYHAVRDTLREMAEGGGRNVENDFFGRPGGYHTRCSRLSRDEPCRICGSSIYRRSYLGGAIYYCPECQRLA